MYKIDIRSTIISTISSTIIGNEIVALLQKLRKLLEKCLGMKGRPGNWYKPSHPTHPQKRMSLDSRDLTMQ